jgi:DNA-binding LacI/PurR family transcriptional regulator
MSRERRKPSYKMVADISGLSPATVSRVVTGHGRVSPESRQRIFDAMRQAGFGLAAEKLVGLIIPDTSNPYFGNLGMIFQEQLGRLGVRVLTASSEGRPDRELQLVSEFGQLGVRGLIYISGGPPRVSVQDVLAASDIPVVAFDRYIDGDNLDFVTVDSRRGIARAVDYLVTLGHKRIGHIKGLQGTRNCIDRWEAFTESLERNEIELDDAWVWQGDYSFGSGRAAAEEMFYGCDGDLPTAVLAANDLMALGFMQRLQQEGMSIPRDLSVVGFDNVETTEWVHPRLTTVEQPVGALAYHAIAFLMERIRHHEESPGVVFPARSEELEPQLIPRESTAGPPEMGASPIPDGSKVVPLHRPSLDAN